MKRIVALILAASLLLCGCRKTQLSGVSNLDLWLTSQDRADIYERLAERWNETHPEKQIRLTISVYSSQSIAGKFSRVFSVSTGYNGSGIPDLVELDYTTFPENVFQQTADIYPLQNMLEKHGSVVPGASLYSKNAICFALPYQRQQLMLCCRLDLKNQLAGFRNRTNSFEGLLELGKAYAEATGEPLLWVDYLGSETFLALYVQALEGLQDPEAAYELAVSCLKEAQTANAWGFLPSGDAYSDSFVQLMAEKKVPCFITTQANLQRLARQEESIAQNYGVAKLPSFNGTNCRVDAPTVAVAIYMSGGDTVLARDFLEYCRFSDAAKDYRSFYLGENGPELLDLSDTYQVWGSLELPEGSVSLTAIDLEPYLTAYSQQVLGADLP